MSDDNKRIDPETGTETVGHEWDGIEELNTPLPRWWLWTFYATIIWGVVFTVMFPAWPMLERATAGVLGWSSRAQLDATNATFEARRAPVLLALARTPLDQIRPGSPEMKAAVAGGQSAFKVYCVQCHGSGAAGSKGYPNLNDDDWLWGGDINAIHYTVENGVRQPDNDATRLSMMPAFGRDNILTRRQIADVVSYVEVISGQAKAGPASNRGTQVFADNCASCHGAEGGGDRMFGAPNLTDAIWLYGGDRATLVETVANSRGGVMPSWAARLDAPTINMLAAYVHSLGGGEETAQAVNVPQQADETANVTP